MVLMVFIGFMGYPSFCGIFAGQARDKELAKAGKELSQFCDVVHCKKYPFGIARYV